jgi:hypothetical protein
MGVFAEQVEERLINDEEALKEAFADLSASIMGERAAYAILKGTARQEQTAVRPILR